MFHELMRHLPDVEQPQDQNDDQGYNDTGAEQASEQEPQQPPTSSAAADYSFIPEHWRPQQFANPDEELKFYREKYAGVFQHLQSEDFVNTFLENYRDQLSSTEQEVDNFKTMLQAFRSNPEQFIAANMPQYAQAMGLQTQMSDEDIDEAIDEAIAKEFGENWQETFDTADLTRRSSISSKIFRRRQELERHYEEQNKTAEEQRKTFISKLQQGATQQQQPTQNIEAVADSLEEAYNSIFAPAGFSEDEYIEIVKSAQSYTPDMVDIYRVTHYDELIK